MAENETHEWFSVKDAAKYLSVSEPTIFRWMKEGVLSFYKVGNSTRFSKQSLEAVVEKVTGSTEAEAARGRCASCGHSGLVEGQVRGSGLLYFRPAETKFWTLKQSLVRTKAHACSACGHIQMHADVKHLNQLTKEGPEADAAASQP